jgi:hypothetical protein
MENGWSKKKTFDNSVCLNWEFVGDEISTSPSTFSLKEKKKRTEEQIITLSTVRCGM